jgi:hypothetical protein
MFESAGALLIGQGGLGFDTPWLPFRRVGKTTRVVLRQTHKKILCLPDVEPI